MESTEKVFKKVVNIYIFRLLIFTKLNCFQGNKRNWVPEPGEEAMDSGIKKQKSIIEISRKVESSNNYPNDDSNIGNESDSDADYDDLDDLALPSDNDDFLDDDGDPDEDDKSVHSTATTVSDSSACSNTPSLIGESGESSALSTQDNTVLRKHAWVSREVDRAVCCVFSLTSNNNIYS